MELAGYFLSLLIGLSLGLIGGGGSVLTVPILVYLFRLDPIVATNYSLFIVGMSSAVATAQKWQKKQIDLRVALVFGIPSLLALVFVRRVILPIIPQTIKLPLIPGFERSTMMMVLFALLMTIVALGILRPQKMESPVLPRNLGLVLAGAVVGLIAGLLGAGGGFIIIPALVFYAVMDIKRAVGTSLLIITANSSLGFLSGLNHYPIEWDQLSVITALSILGTFIGHRLSDKMPALTVKRTFGISILILAVVIFVSELLH